MIPGSSEKHKSQVFRRHGRILFQQRRLHRIKDEFIHMCYRQKGPIPLAEMDKRKSKDQHVVQNQKMTEKSLLAQSPEIVLCML